MKNAVTIIGCGMVGSTIAFKLLDNKLVDEIRLVDINSELADAQALDIGHSAVFGGRTLIRTGSYADLKNSKVVIIAAGIAQKRSSQSRMDLLFDNSRIINSILGKVFKKNPDIFVVIVTNPVDVLTYLAIKSFPDKSKQIIGTGTLLDTARFKYNLAGLFKVNPRSINALVVGEHGDTQVALWSTLKIKGKKINASAIASTRKVSISQKTVQAAADIIKGKGVSHFGISGATNEIVTSLLQKRKTVLPVSHLIQNDYHIDDVCMSLPVELSSKGIGKRIKLKLTTAEQDALLKSAKFLKKVID